MTKKEKKFEIKKIVSFFMNFMESDFDGDLRQWCENEIKKIRLLDKQEYRKEVLGV